MTATSTTTTRATSNRPPRARHSFFLKVEPFPTPRVKCACRGRFPTVYNDPRYREWKAEAVEQLRTIHGRYEDFRAFAESDVIVNLTVVVEKPKTTKKVRPKGDRDNFEKGVFDAITEAGIWWKDDDQIVGGEFEKRWAREGESPGYYVDIQFL